MADAKKKGDIETIERKVETVLQAKQGVLDTEEKQDKDQEQEKEKEQEKDVQKVHEGNETADLTETAHVSKAR